MDCVIFVFFFFKQKTAYEMRISDWSSDVCSSDLLRVTGRWEHTADNWINDLKLTYEDVKWAPTPVEFGNAFLFAYAGPSPTNPQPGVVVRGDILRIGGGGNYQNKGQNGWRSEGHTSELQSLMRSSYAVFCLQKKKMN